MGALGGCVSGWVTRRVVKKRLAAGNKEFFAVWYAALFARLVLTLALFVILYKAGWAHPVAFILSFILAQTAMQVAPLKAD